MQNSILKLVHSFKTGNLTARCMILSLLLYPLIVLSFGFPRFLAPVLDILYRPNHYLPYLWFVRNRYDVMFAHKYATNGDLYYFLLYDMFSIIAVIWSAAYISLSFILIRQRDFYIQSLKLPGNSVGRHSVAWLALTALILLVTFNGAPHGGDLLDTPSSLKALPGVYLLMETLLFSGGLVTIFSEGLIFSLWWTVRGRYIVPEGQVRDNNGGNNG